LFEKRIERGERTGFKSYVEGELMSSVMDIISLQYLEDTEITSSLPPCPARDMSSHLNSTPQAVPEEVCRFPVW
jgi:hypothetical protein